MDKVHFIGIGGIGMSGLARILLKKNIAVSGSDLNQNALTLDLEKQGAKVFVGHSEKHVSAGTTVVYSSGVPKENPEYQSALEHNCQVMHRSDLLHSLTEGYKTIAVAGTHGKTTTSALLTAIFKESGFDPAFAVGGVVTQYETNAGYGEGDYFIAEADESDGTFLKYFPHSAIITNIGIDHLPHYGDENTLLDAFQTFANQVSEHTFWCADDERLRSFMSGGISYGMSEKSDLQITRCWQKGWSLFFDVTFFGKKYDEIEVSLIGKHNVLNACACFGLALTLGIPEEKVRGALATFQGAKRRAEKKALIKEALLLDDYAHHPTEIKTTLEGIRSAIGEKKLIALYQPHRNSRIKDCLGSFGSIFDAADEVIVTDIFSAGESPIPGVSHEEIQKEIQVPCRYIPRGALAKEVTLVPHDVLITLGAGDITKFSDEYLAVQKPKSLKLGIICGGGNVEHEVSLTSAKNVIGSYNPELYDVTHFGITKKRTWVLGEPNEGAEEILSAEVMQELLACDIVFPVLHGPYVEDGALQGFFETLNIPYICSDWRSCALCMDKARLKHLMRSHGIATADFVDFSSHQWKTEKCAILEEIEKQLVFPLFVKPSHLGSSVGITKVENKEALEKAIENALLYDHEILVENEIPGRELEIAVLGTNELQIFPPGEICANGKPYDYEAKYKEGGFSTLTKAPLTDEQVEKARGLAEKAYLLSGCSTFARVDVRLDSQGTFWLNEINPIPGFTDISLYPKICKEAGISMQKLIDHLVILALHRNRLYGKAKKLR